MDRLGLSRIQAVGLTGGIGSGKSTVARLLVGCGAHLVDTDAIARTLTQPGGGAMGMIAQTFGPQAVAADGSLDRDHMRARAFAEPDAKRRLEAILHPMIGTEARRQAAAAQDRTVVFDVPLLTESSHWRARVQRLLVVDCSADTQISRVVTRAGWTAEAAQRVIGQQASRPQRRAIADAVIFNDGISLAALESEVHALWAVWTGASAPP